MLERNLITFIAWLHDKSKGFDEQCVSKCLEEMRKQIFAWAVKIWYKQGDFSPKKRKRREVSKNIHAFGPLVCGSSAVFDISLSLSLSHTHTHTLSLSFSLCLAREYILSNKRKIKGDYNFLHQCSFLSLLYNMCVYVCVFSCAIFMHRSTMLFITCDNDILAKIIVEHKLCKRIALLFGTLIF